MEATDLAKRLDAMEAQLDYLVSQQRKTEEFFAEMAPVARAVMATSMEKLDALDRKGYFAFGREFVKLGDRIAEGFRLEDVRQLGDAIVAILQTVRAMTQPRVLQIADEAAEVIEKADAAEPIGMFGAMRATHDDDVRKGMAVMMELMRHVGRAARSRAETPIAKSAVEERRQKLAAALGPRRKKDAPHEKTNGAPPPPACSAPRRPARVATVIGGVAFGEDGHLVDPKAWTLDVAAKIAAAHGVPLDEAHLAIVRVARADFEETGSSPNIRRITQLAGVATKDLYALFPTAPARTVAKIAGIPKPAGCI